MGEASLRFRIPRGDRFGTACVGGGEMVTNVGSLRDGWGGADVWRFYKRLIATRWTYRVGDAAGATNI